MKRLDEVMIEMNAKRFIRYGHVIGLRFGEVVYKMAGMEYPAEKDCVITIPEANTRINLEAVLLIAYTDIESFGGSWNEYVKKDPSYGTRLVFDVVKAVKSIDIEKVSEYWGEALRKFDERMSALGYKDGYFDHTKPQDYLSFSEYDLFDILDNFGITPKDVVNDMKFYFKDKKNWSDMVDEHLKGEEK